MVHCKWSKQQSCTGKDLLHVDSLDSSALATGIIGTYNNYLTKGGGGGSRAPQNPPLVTPLMRRKSISPSLVYVLHKTCNLAFSCPGRVVMAKKIYKKA